MASKEYENIGLIGYLEKEIKERPLVRSPDIDGAKASNLQFALHSTLSPDGGLVHAFLYFLKHYNIFLDLRTPGSIQVNIFMANCKRKPAPKNQCAPIIFNPLEKQFDRIQHDMDRV